jgi:hypothetical protein
MGSTPPIRRRALASDIGIMPTEEQDAARDRIQTAIEDYLRLGDEDGDGALDADSFVSQWAIVVHVPPIVNTGKSVYWTLYSTDEIPTHVAVGLYQIGISHVLERADEDDD